MRFVCDRDHIYVCFGTDLKLLKSSVSIFIGSHTVEGFGARVVCGHGSVKD